MNITVPRALIVTLAAVFSGYHLVLATYSITVPIDVGPYVAAMVLYALATTVSLWGSVANRMPWWMAAINVLVAVVLPVLVTSQFPPDHTVGNDYSTWYVAAVGTLMVITSTRKRHFFAWAGVASLVVHTVLWAGPQALPTIGVLGSVVWVAVSHALSVSLAKAGRDAENYARAEREATEWQAAQEARLVERQGRLRSTSRMALPMLRLIVRRRGDLSEPQREECLTLEAAIRDEVRGRRLLDDRVRDVIMEARRAGKVVTLLDEGGLDDLPARQLARVHAALADAIGTTDADRLIVRTVQGSRIAATVVGLRSTPEDEDARALGYSAADEDDDNAVDLWLEIPRFG